MKKITAFLVALSVCVTETGITSMSGINFPNISITASAEETGTYGDLTYIQYDDYVTIAGCDRFATQIEIPSEIDGLPVTSIDDMAFYYCTSLTNITILNPECEIYEYGGTIHNGYASGYYFDGTIYGYENSTAQTYAETYGYAFESLGAAPDTTTEENDDVKYMLANGITQDFNNDGQIDAKDTSMILLYAAQRGAGLVKNLEEFIESQNI